MAVQQSQPQPRKEYDRHWHYWGGGFIAVASVVLGVGALAVYTKQPPRPLLWTTWYAVVFYACFALAAACGVAAALNAPFPFTPLTKGIVSTARFLRQPWPSRLGEWIDKQNDPLPSSEAETAVPPPVVKAGVNAIGLAQSGKASLESEVVVRHKAQAVQEATQRREELVLQGEDLKQRLRGTSNHMFGTDGAALEIVSRLDPQIRRWVSDVLAFRDSLNLSTASYVGFMGYPTAYPVAPREQLGELIDRNLAALRRLSL
jgi:hypothetical protein